MSRRNMLENALKDKKKSCSRERKCEYSRIVIDYYDII